MNPTTAAVVRELRMALWEGDEYVITADGMPIGPTLSKIEAHAVLRWAQSALLELSQRPPSSAAKKGEE